MKTNGEHEARRRCPALRDRAPTEPRRYGRSGTVTVALLVVLFPQASVAR
jgi:hypothetical protein